MMEKVDVEEEENNEEFEIDLNTGVVYKSGEGPPPSRFLTFVATVFGGSAIGEWASKQIKVAKTVEEVIEAYEAQMTTCKLLGLISVLAILFIGHAVSPYLGLFVLIVYGAYVCLLTYHNLRGKINFHKKEAFKYANYTKYKQDQEKAEKHHPGQGQYL